MKTYLIALLKLVIIVFLFPSFSSFVITNLLDIKGEWIYELFMLLSIIFAMNALPDAFSKPYAWQEITDTRSKVLLSTTFIIVLIIGFCPSSQGINEVWVDTLFLMVGALIAAPLWVGYFKKLKEK